MGHQENLLNFELLNIAKGTAGHHKVAFVPSSDPSMGAGGGGAPPGGDPSGGGGGMPPGGGGGAGLDAIMQKLNQLTMMGQGGAGGAGGAGGLKPKIDQNMVSVQILKTLARICDHLGIHVPMSDMVPGMGDLNQLAQATQGQAPMPGAGGGGGDPSGGGGAPGAIGGMPPMDPMQGAGQPGMAPKTGSYRGNGVAFDTGGFIE